MSGEGRLRFPLEDCGLGFESPRSSTGPRAISKKSGPHHALALAEALESTAIVEAGTLTEAEAVSFLQRVAGWLMAAIRAEVDIVRRNGLVYVPTFMTMMAAYYGQDASEIGR